MITPVLRASFERNRAAIDAANACGKCCGTRVVVEPCGECDGRGTVPPAGNGPYWDREREECIACSGYGEDEVECPDCEGSGEAEALPVTSREMDR